MPTGFFGFVTLALLHCACEQPRGFLSEQSWQSEALESDDECDGLGAGSEPVHCALVALQRAWPKPDILSAGFADLPGASAWVSQKGIDDISKHIIPHMVQNLSEKHMADMQGTHKGIHYTISQLHVRSPSIRSSKLEFVADAGIHLCLEGLRSDISMHWTSKWSFVSSGGGATASMTDSNLCALLSIFVSPTGHPKVALSDVKVEIKLDRVRFTKSMLSWIYNAAAYVFKSRLEHMMSKTVASELQTAFSERLNAHLNGMDFSIRVPLEKIHDDLVIDLSLLSLETTHSFLKAGVRGSTYQLNNRKLLYPEPPLPVPDAPPPSWWESMLTFSISERMFDSLVWFLHENKLLTYTIRPSEIPSNDFGLELSTSFFSYMCPGLGEAYPRNHSMTVTASTDSIPPLLSFETDAVGLSVPMAFDFHVLLPENQSRFAFTIHALINGTGRLWVEDGKPQLLRSNISITSASKARLGKSDVGDVDVTFLNQLLDVARVPAQTAIQQGPLAKGLPLAFSKGRFYLSNTVPKLTSAGLSVFSDMGLS
eukprot:TRINITY_DN88349_c0_g1_i1.p1 TRINITY_DN88349_c0_g1~~TRINITY_DN88349_c0_g1_i1.p1  ORF type:complete len:540 (-),score=62.72 TRINITY_DN88349_c0_g1_i1:294-1913(-)